MQTWKKWGERYGSPRIVFWKQRISSISFLYKMGEKRTDRRELCFKNSIIHRSFFYMQTWKNGEKGTDLRIAFWIDIHFHSRHCTLKFIAKFNNWCFIVSRHANDGISSSSAFLTLPYGLPTLMYVILSFSARRKFLHQTWKKRKQAENLFWKLRNSFSPCL
jgi:hypothetical protein